MKKLRYGNIIILTTLQHDGHTKEYLIPNTKKLIAFYLLHRKGKEKNFIEIYDKGRMIEKKILISPGNIILSYILLYFQYLWILFTYFKAKETVYFINYHPLFFFCNSLVKKFRKIEFVYWIGDYWPMNDLSIRLFRFLMHFYHRGVKYAMYQTDRINERMNGKVIKTMNKKTIRPGVVMPKIDLTKKIGDNITIGFIGVLVSWQGIEVILKVVKENKNIKLRLIGTGDTKLVQKYKKLIDQYKIADRVYFPNKFFYGDELHNEVKSADLGIALYELDPNKVTYYAAPAKILHYIEFGLPVIMTPAAEVANFIKQFDSGIIVNRNIQNVANAVLEMKKDYTKYLKGVNAFAKHFNYQGYYKRMFLFLES